MWLYDGISDLPCGVEGCECGGLRAGSKARGRVGSGVVSDDQAFRAVWLLALLLMVAAAIPLAGRNRRVLRQAAIWVLAGGFLFAFYRIAEWLWS